MQMTVGPAERCLDNVVEVVEEQVGRDLETTPQRRFGALEIDTDPIGDDIEAARRRRDGGSVRMNGSTPTAPLASTRCNTSWSSLEPRPDIASVSCFSTSSAPDAVAS